MSREDFENERYRVEHVIEILQHAVRRLEDRAQVPVSLLRDAVTFIRTAEEKAYEASQVDDEPGLSSCVEHHLAARRPLSEMEQELRALELGDTSATSRFARAARDYVELRRRHFAADDRLFARGHRRLGSGDDGDTPAALIESSDTRRLYDRLVEAAAMLDIAMPAVYRTGRGRWQS